MAWLLISNVAAIVLGFGLIKIISKIGTAEYGKFALVLSLVPLINALIYTPVDLFCQRHFYTYQRENHLGSFIASIFRLLKTIAWYLAALFVAALLVLRFAFGLDLRSICFLIAAGLYIVVFANAIPFLSLLNTMRLRSQVALFAVGEKLAQFLILGGLSFYVGLNSSWVLGVFVALGTIFLAAKIKLVAVRVSAKQAEEDTCDKIKTRQISRKLMVFALPILGFGVLAWFQAYSERWVIQFTLDLDAVGIYAFMVMIATTSLSLMLGSFAQFVGPITWEKFSDLKDSTNVASGLRFIRLQVWFVGLITGVAALFLYFIGDRMISMLGGERFAVHARLLPLIFIGIGLFNIGQTLNSIGFGYDRMQKYTVAKVAGAVLAVALLWLGARMGGVTGVAWASVAANSIYVVLTMLANRKILRERRPPSVFKNLVEQSVG